MKPDEMTIEIRVTLDDSQRLKHSASRLLAELENYLASASLYHLQTGLEGCAKQVSITVDEPECADYKGQRSVASFVTMTQGDEAD